MTRLLSAMLLSLIVAGPAFAQDTATPPPTIVQTVRAAIVANDFAKAEKLALDDMKAKGTTPIALEAFSWLGRGAVAAKNYDAAMTYAARTYEMVEAQLKTRKLDDEARLPIALGAAIEVTALATAGQGGRSDAVLYLRKEIDTYKGTSIIERLNKNVNLLSLEGTPALSLDSPKWIGAPPPSMASLKGKPVIVYLWAHWCPDCKVQGPVLEAMLDQVLRLRRQARAGGAGRGTHLSDQHPRQRLSLDEDDVGADQRADFCAVWRLDHAHAGADRSRRQRVEVQPRPTDRRTTRTADSEDHRAGRLGPIASY